VIKVRIYVKACQIVHGLVAMILLMEGFTEFCNINYIIDNCISNVSLII